MGTSKKRFSITVSDDLWNIINDYQHKHKLSTQTKAINALIKIGAATLQSDSCHSSVLAIEEQEISHSPKDLILLQKYNSLDHKGQELVDMVLEHEYGYATADNENIRFKSDENPAADI